MEQLVLEMKNIDKSFGGTHALNDINFQLRKGEVHALLGENGAGKSTLIKTLGGIHKPDGGTILINGKEVSMTGIHEAQAYGIGIIHQEIVLVPYLTVAENIFLGREITNKLGFKDMNEINNKAAKMAATLGLDIDVTTPVKELTIAQQQMVEIVKASSFNVKILVMDEPTSSLSDEEVDKLFDTIKRLKSKEVSIIYISHRMEELFKITDRVTVIRDGTYVGTVDTRETNHDNLVAMMVGRKLENYYTRDFCKQNEEVVRVNKLTKKGVFENISFSVKKGEILGFAGLVGAGRSEIMMSLFAADSYDSGNVYLYGKQVKFKNCKEAIDNGIAMVPEDRKLQGLTLVNSVEFNTALAALKFMMNGVLISSSKREEIVFEYIKDLNIKMASKDISVSSLSGGNQQKVVLAKWLATRPKLLILDEPTRGVDVGAKSEIYAIINELAKAGLAIIMVSSDLPEIINMCDRVCVIREGRMAGEIDHASASQESIMKFATAGTN